LLEHESVAEAAVVPSPDPIRLAIPKAYVLLVSGAERSPETALSIFRHLHTRLAPFKRIRRIELVTELPKTISGKIRRVELREMERQKALTGCDEVIFLNKKGELTEGTRTTLFIELDGRLFTPALACGLLPGTLREELLDLPRAAAHRVDQAVVRNTKHPCRKRGALRLEGVYFLVHAGEDVGSQILSLFCVSVQPLEQVAKYARRVPLVQFVKGFGIAGANAAHQVFGIRDS